MHCDAGKSRSPAVAAALARVLDGDDAHFFGGRYTPNMRVYRTLLESSVAARGERAGVDSAKRHLGVLGALAPALRPRLVRARCLPEALDALAA